MVQSHVEKVNTLLMLEVCWNPCVGCIHLPTCRSTMDRHVGHVVMETSQAQPYHATDSKKLRYYYMGVNLFCVHLAAMQTYYTVKVL